MAINSSNSTNGYATRSSEERDQELLQIRTALNELRYGSVLVIVQDGVVVQIDRTEKRRLRRPSITNDSTRCVRLTRKKRDRA